MAESGGDSSEKGSKRPKLEVEEDRLSALPDSIIHHVLSFLPSTREMIRTGVLSKRWLHQWTRIPVLIFDFFEDYCFNRFTRTDFSLFLDSSLILYDCSKLRKFHLEIECKSGDHNRELRFASMRNVEEFILNFSGSDEDYKLPKFLFTNSSLVRLDTCTCRFVSDLKVNFESLKSLRIENSTLDDGAIENVIRGSPLLESLELCGCFCFERLVINSKSLKCLILIAELYASLIEIECPKLEEMELYMGSDILHTVTFRSKLPPLKCAILEYAHVRGDFDEDSAKKLLSQFQHVENLRIVGELVKTALREGGLSTPLNSKILTLVCDNFEKHLPEIKYALCSSPLLGKLVIELPVCVVFLDVKSKFD